MANIVVNESLLDAKLAELEQVRSWSPRVVSRVETMITTADDYQLFRINPVQFAADKGVAENEALDLFLYGTKLGIFEMDWHLICPSCGHVVKSFAELKHLHSHFVCDLCYAEKEASFDDYIQVTFTIQPQIRRIRYHDPYSLDIEDFFFRYQFCKDLRPSPEEMSADPDTMCYIESGETVTFEVDLEPNTLLLLRDPTKVHTVFFEVSDCDNQEVQNVSIRLIDNRYESLSHPAAAQHKTHGIFVRKFPQVGQLCSGRAVLEIHNQMDQRTPMWIVHVPFDEKYYQSELELAPFVSGKRLLTHQTFRSLFRTEVLQVDEEIAVKDITILFTDLKGSTAMYDSIGDAKAYYLVRQHFDTLHRVIASHSGAIVKTIGDAVMATFMNPVDAVEAAIEMLHDLDEFNRTISTPLILKIGIHRGHSIVVTLNDRLDYFGQTVNIAARVQALADSHEICISQDAFEVPNMSHTLRDYGVAPDDVEVKGVSGKLRVHKMRIVEG